ncbi:AMP-binding protein [Actinocorallia sp. A-T 12471]|uniref:AMP-binding protein n=1 Tax=Actinocorallia sp. A-T 12471 TaxID=3089813 RepID=UPI0029D1429A|nr:AMP-binding protein [Actinocorallia sp. A-T 12471]MDX6742204.1 AMP-binding protein [Actinocorallia sp. A-T 12471]
MTSVRDRLAWARASARAGLLGPMGPRTARKVARAMRAYGALGAATAVGAARFGDRPALADDFGVLSYRALDQAVEGVCSAWAARGIGPQDRVGVLCRNHRGFLIALTAATRLGARVVLLNTDSAAPELAAVTTTQALTALAHDTEFTERLSGLEFARGTFTADPWPTDASGSPPVESDLAVLAREAGEVPPPPSVPGTLVILSSGTTGRPKGARRSPAPGEPLALPGGILSRIPFRGGEAVFVAPPLFHGWGLTSATLALSLGCTLVLHRRFAAERVLAALAEARCAAFVAVPTMVSRLLAAPGFGSADLGALRIVVAGGGPLSAELSGRVMAALGPVLYNFYGSTEASCVAIATPADLAAAPGCAGTPPPGTRVTVLGPDGSPVPPGTVGRIHVASPTRFEGYTGSEQAAHDARAGLGLGDLGFFDDGGRLHVTGRADAMVVSGGENVHPAEVEELLEQHPDVIEAAVVGVPDADFGSRLRAYVVTSGGLDADAVRAHVAARLSRAKVPRDVVFVAALPRTATGKVRRHELP